MILIDNPNHAALEVIVDGELVGKVGADSTARFGPFGRGEHKVVTRYRCNQRHLTLRTSRDVVELRRGRPARLQVRYVRKGIVDLSNDWVQPMRVYVDGKSVGTVRAGATLGAFARRGSTIEMRDPQGNIGLRESISLSGLEIAGMELNPAPRAYVTVFNPAPVRVRVAVGGDDVRIRPGSSARVLAPTGWARLTASRRGQTIDTQKVLVSPFASREYAVRVPTTASLRFQNDNRVAVKIYGPNGRYLGRAGAGETVTLQNLAVGDCTLEVVAQLRRRTVRERVAVSIDPFRGGSVASRMSIRDGRGGYATAGNSADCDTDTRSTRRSSRRGRGYASR